MLKLYLGSLVPDADESEYPLRTCILEQFDTGVMLHAANVVSNPIKERHTMQTGYVWGQSKIAKQLLRSPIYGVGSNLKPAARYHSRLPSLELSKPCLS